MIHYTVLINNYREGHEFTVHVNNLNSSDCLLDSVKPKSSYVSDLGQLVQHSGINPKTCNNVLNSTDTCSTSNLYIPVNVHSNYVNCPIISITLF